jgi:hypothetical protein
MDIIGMAWGIILIAFVLGFACGILIPLIGYELPQWLNDLKSTKWQRDYKDYLRKKELFEGK